MLHLSSIPLLAGFGAGRDRCHLVCRTLLIRGTEVQLCWWWREKGAGSVAVATERQNVHSSGDGH